MGFFIYRDKIDFLFTSSINITGSKSLLKILASTPLSVFIEMKTLLLAKSTVLKDNPPVMA